MKVTRKSYGSKILSSIVGALIGIVLFLGSFVVLYLNEGRENMGAIAEVATEITQDAHGLEKGTLISLKGSLDGDVYASDIYLTDGNYIIIDRTVEMYAYVESSRSETRDNLGGSSTTVTTYSYSQQWTSDPKKSTTFAGDQSELPANIPTSYNEWIDGKPENSSSQAENLSMGRYTVSSNVTFSGVKSLSLTSALADTSTLTNTLISGNYIYYGNQENISTTPKLGDIRISYTVIKSTDTGVLLGAIDGDTITSFTTPKNNKLLRFFAEASSREEAISILQTEYKTLTWILRIVGFLMMFIGLVAMTGPVTKFLSVIPIFSKISGFIFGVIAFFIALVLTSLTVVLAMILHNFWLALAFVAIVIIVTIIIISKKRANAIE